MYLRFVALGDSTTVGIGDPTPLGWRGWATLVAGSLQARHDVSYCNLAVAGATTASVRAEQLSQALAHSPDLAALIVGINDTTRSSWDPVRLRADLMASATALHEAGATLITARFHDHGRVFGLPTVLRRPLWERIEVVNSVTQEVLDTFGGLRIDLASWPAVYERRFWSVDRLHPSELGHRALAHACAVQLRDRGVDLMLPELDAGGGRTPTPLDDARWVLTEGVPWVGRRARDLGPWAAKMAWAQTSRRGRTLAPARVQPRAPLPHDPHARDPHARGPHSPVP